MYIPTPQMAMMPSHHSLAIQQNGYFANNLDAQRAAHFYPTNYGNYHHYQAAINQLPQQWSQDINNGNWSMHHHSHMNSSPIGHNSLSAERSSGSQDYKFTNPGSSNLNTSFSSSGSGTENSSGFASTSLDTNYSTSQALSGMQDLAAGIPYTETDSKADVLEEGFNENKFYKEGKTRTKDKYRVVYTQHQLMELEKEFLYSKYIAIHKKGELAHHLGLSERQVKIWFQNRRAKEKRMYQKVSVPPMNCSQNMNMQYYA